MALPYQGTNPYTSAMQRRMQQSNPGMKPPQANQFQNNQMQPMGGMQALQSQGGMSTTTEPEVPTPAAPQVMTAPPQVAPTVNNPRLQAQQGTPITTSTTGTVQAQPQTVEYGGQGAAKAGGGKGGKGDGKKGDGKKGDGKGDGGGGGGGEQYEGDPTLGGYEQDTNTKYTKAPKINTSKKRVTKGLKKPQKKWLAGDPTFQAQMAGYLAQKGDARTNWQEDMDMLRHNYIRDAKLNRRNRGRALGELEGNFADSGTLHSSGYGLNYGETESDFAQNKMNLLDTLKGGQQDLTSGYGSFLRQMQVDQLAARQDALMRLAAKKIGGVAGIVPTS